MVSILGKSGTGKTTILNIIAGLESIDSGEFTVDNEVVGRFSNEKLTAFRRRNIAYVFQNYNLVDELTVLQNIKIFLAIKGCKISIRDIERKLDEFGMRTITHQKAITLSGGEKQRTSLISAVLSDCPVLLLDEPTGSLDSTNSRILMEDIKRIAESKLVIMVSHNPELISEFSDVTMELIANSLRVVKDESTTEIKQISDNSRGKRSGFVRLFLSRISLTNRKSNVVTVAVSSFAFACLILGSLFFVSIESIVERCLLDRPDANIVKIEKTEETLAHGSVIQMTKSKRPRLEEINNTAGLFDVTDVDYSLGGLLEEVQTFKYNGVESEAVLFKPYHSPTAGVNTVVINQKMADLIEYKSGKLELKITKTITLYDDSYKKFIDEILYIKETLQVSEVYKEFYYLQTPTVYYSYYGWKEYFDNLKPENFNSVTGQDMSWLDMIVAAGDDSKLSDYSMLVLAKTPGEIRSLYRYFLSGQTIRIKANHFTIRLSLDSLFTLVSYGLSFFLTVILLVSLFVFGILVYSNYMTREKEILNYYTIGVSMRVINGVFLLQKGLVSIVSFLLSVVVVTLLVPYINGLVSSFGGLESVLSPDAAAKYLVYGSIFVLLIATTIIAVFLPLSFRQREKANSLMRLRK